MKKKEPRILDVPSIQKSIHEKHQTFINNFGMSVEKVIADQRLMADIILTKLYRVALIFREEKIIDDVKITEKGPYKRISLTKNGYNDYVDLVTNGETIVFEGYSYTTGLDSDWSHQQEKIRGVNNEDFDWDAFALKLLDYIHSSIYERKRAAELKLSGEFTSYAKDTDAKRKNLEATLK